MRMLDLKQKATYVLHRIGCKGEDRRQGLLEASSTEKDTSWEIPAPLLRGTLPPIFPGTGDIHNATDDCFLTVRAIW